MKKINSTIINVEKIDSVNKNGEALQFTKVLYTIDREATEREIGPAILECYIPRHCLDKFKNYLMKPIQIELAEKTQKNGMKYIISKINNESI